MRIAGVTMVRDEADIIERTLRHLLAQGVDEIIVADNLSADETPEILARLAAEAPITVVADDEAGYYQDRKMNELARIAGAEHGADWIVPFDADEFWCGREGTLREAIEATHAAVIDADTHYHQPGADPHMRPAEQVYSTKVCYRWEESSTLLMGNHDVSHNGVRESGTVVIHEFQYRSFEQFVRKVRNGAAAYAATDLSDDWGTHWRRYGAMSDAELAAEWETLTRPAENLVWDPWEPSA